MDNGDKCTFLTSLLFPTSTMVKTHFVTLFHLLRVFLLRHKISKTLHNLIFCCFVLHLYEAREEEGTTYICFEVFVIFSLLVVLNLIQQKNLRKEKEKCCKAKLAKIISETFLSTIVDSGLYFTK